MLCDGCIVDERQEIALCVQSAEQHGIGPPQWIVSLRPGLRLHQLQYGRLIGTSITFDSHCSLCGGAAPTR